MKQNEFGAAQQLADDVRRDIELRDQLALRAAVQIRSHGARNFFIEVTCDLARGAPCAVYRVANWNHWALIRDQIVPQDRRMWFQWAATINGGDEEGEQ